MNGGWDSVFYELVNHRALVEEFLLVEVSAKLLELWVFGAIISLPPLVLIPVDGLHVSWLRELFEILPLRLRAQGL